jgi:flavin-dependent dehydrogenase
MSLKHVNAVVVGAGTGGGIVAKELSEAGLSVVLLERSHLTGSVNTAALLVGILGSLIEEFLDPSSNLSPKPILDANGEVKVPGGQFKSNTRFGERVYMYSPNFRLIFSHMQLLLVNRTEF